jgi:hypothetical protein
MSGTFCTQKQAVSVDYVVVKSSRCGTTASEKPEVQILPGTISPSHSLILNPITYPTDRSLAECFRRPQDEEFCYNNYNLKFGSKKLTVESSTSNGLVSHVIDIKNNLR